jgi:uncharacterized cupin superfamily protein
VANLHDPDFDELREHPGFRTRRARVGRQLRSERLGASVWELPPGEAAYPYHYHLVEEEMLFVLRGEVWLRDPTGWRALAEGEIVSFPPGEAGAHQLVNRGAQPARLLTISTNGTPDIVIYPDSDKLGANERLPEGGGLSEMYRRSESVDYYDGETPPQPPR